MPYDAKPWLASYPSDVPTEFEPPDVPLTALLDDAAEAFPGNAAIASAGTVLTYPRPRRRGAPGGGSPPRGGGGSVRPVPRRPPPPGLRPRGRGGPRAPQPPPPRHAG